MSTSTPARARRVAGWLVAPSAVVLAALCAAMWFDVLLGNLAPVAQALTPVWVLAGLVVLVLALAVRTRPALVAAVPLVIALVAAVAAFTTRPEPTQAVSQGAGEHRLRILTLNTEFGRADVASVMHAVASAAPDVVVFVEMTKPKLAQLDAAGLRALLPHRSMGMHDEGARGSIVLSRYGVTTLDADAVLGPWDLQSPLVRIAAPGGDVAVRAVHTYPPLRDGVDQWRPQLLRVGEWQRSNPAKRLILAGDFNASFAHPAFRHLSEGLVDAYPAVHGAWTPTWPDDERPLPPFAQIDHVLTRGFVPVHAGVVSVNGTDHAGVWSELRY